jgi:hypothetical protein
MTNRLGRAEIALPDVVITVVAFAMAALVVDAVPPTAQQPVLEWWGGARSDWINVLSNDISNCKVRMSVAMTTTRSVGKACLADHLPHNALTSRGQLWCQWW